MVDEKSKDMEEQIKTSKPDYNSPDNSKNAPNPGQLPEITEQQRKEMEKTREKLEKFKKSVLKKFPFFFSIGIIPPQACEKIEEEEQVPIEECKKKPIHIILLMPEEQFKNIKKIKPEIIKLAADIKPPIWVHVKTPIDVFNYGLDSKFDIVSAIAMSFPLHDKGFLGSLRAAEIHKSLVLRKFEKYVTSYVLAGSLVRGEATKTSDVDVYVIIDDTDVKRMPRLELKEKLRGIINSYIVEAEELAGVKNKLNVQVYILTEFWEGVKDANPVFFTFIRDGIPLHDRGTFMPWKLLLKMGKLKPSPEAIDMFMSTGEKTVDIAKKRLLDIAVLDLYWGIITPSQALLMLYGVPPPAPKHTVAEMKKVFVDKEKMLEMKYINILEKIIGLYKDYEHEKIKEISGAELDKLMKDFDDYMKRLKELEKQIEKRAHEKTIEQIYDDVFEMLKGIFGKKSEKILVTSFEKEFISKGKFPKKYLEILNDIVKAKRKFKQGKLTKHEVENARKNATILTNSLIEYNQRCELVNLERGRFGLRYGKDLDKIAELILTESGNFLIKEGEINKISSKIEKSNKKELENALNEQKKKNSLKIDSKIFDVLKRELGNFEIVV